MELQFKESRTSVSETSLRTIHHYSPQDTFHPKFLNTTRKNSQPFAKKRTISVQNFSKALSVSVEGILQLNKLYKIH